MTEILLAIALTGSGVCAPQLQVRHVQPVKRVAVKNINQRHVAQKQVQRHVVNNIHSNFVDPAFINNDFYGANQFGHSGILYLAGQNLQTELIVKEAVHEAVKSGVRDGVSSGVSEAMKLLRQELLQGRAPAPTPGPKEPDYFEETPEPIRSDPIISETPLPNVSIAEACARCHTGKQGAPKYNNGILQLQAHKAARAIMDGSMPKGKTLTEEEKAVLIYEFYTRAQGG